MYYEFSYTNIVFVYGVAHTKQLKVEEHSSQDCSPKKVSRNTEEGFCNSKDTFLQHWQKFHVLWKNVSCNTDESLS